MFNALSKKLGKKGFTLIELIVVIAIIAILAVILIPRFTGFTDSAHEKAAISDARNILMAAQAKYMQGTVATDLTDTAIKGYGVAFKGKLSAITVTTGETDANKNGTLNFTYDYYPNASDTTLWYKVTVTNSEVITTSVKKNGTPQLP